jgi:NADPH:quinone reductase-like Zn-dependent oxidoreductase
MRAFAVPSFGADPAVLDVPAPAAAGEFLVRVSYAGVNPTDYKRVERLTASSMYPAVVGVDFSGVLERTPAGESDLRVGDRVFGMARTNGSYAEYTAVAPRVPGEPLARIPAAVTDEQAAALPVPAVAALGSLDELGTVAGQRLVILGAAGAVGGYAVQMARHRGAHVIAVVRSTADADEARGLGAQDVFDSTAADAIGQVRAAYPDGADAVLDVVNGPTLIRRDVELLRPGGRLVSAVHAADEVWFAARQITAHNISGPVNPLSSPQGLDQVAGLLADGVITVRLRFTYELADAASALDQLRAGGMRGKAVIRL